MNRPKRWIIAPPHARAAELAERLKTSPVIAQILLNRGIAQAEECFAFLRPSLKCLHDPGLMPNLPKAAARVAQAIRDKEKIVVYGDYDVDGITATAILWHAIKILGGEVDFYIPHRIDEGYGLNTAAINEIIERGAKLIITVDCGVTAVEQARVAKERGVDLIITDHHEWHEAAPPLTDGEPTHEPGPILPRAYTIVHPRLPTDDDGVARQYPNRAICGAGVAFKLAWGVGQVMTGANRVSDEFRAYLLEATALAALGTIADVVPLVAENRILAAFGLGGLKESKLVGIQALIESAGLTGQTLDSFHVGFLLAPRLNACGRMGHAREAVEMLTRADHARAVEIATFLESQNRDRQAMEKKILDAALAQVEEQKLDGDDCRAIVLGGDGWHPGVIGIVASRIVDRFCKPTIMIAFNENNGNGVIGQGSGRSIAGFHLSRALEHCGELLEAYGGHEMAAGLKVRPENFEDFRRCFCEYAMKNLEPEQLVPELKLDAEAELRQVTEALVNDLKRLGPFGHGNRKPLFCSKNLEIAAPPRRVGKTGDHLQLYVRQGRTSMRAIAFGAGDLFDRLKPGVMVDLAFEPTLNEYNGSSTVELAVKDLQFTG
ncbi:MAG: single-stranded-DNA-specific exonuclease [Phycisphaerales bacterium]|jgi:single-stranded-DNA-specific exonuclease|nr:single-stranded-DNA-specific exonuclease [Phycisphaerales bacterium]